MKNRLLLSLLCVIITHTTLAKANILCDNTSVIKNQRFLPPAKPEKKPAYLPNSLSSFQPFSSLAPAPALSSTMVSKEEIEPNDNPVLATPLGGNDVKVKAHVNPSGDIDFFSFTANAGDRVYAATQTSFSSTGSYDSVLEVIGSNGISVLESDDDDGSFGKESSSIAGTLLQTSGTYYIKVRHKQTNGRLLPYYLYFRLQSGSPTAENEQNGTLATANSLPNSGWVRGSISSAQDLDYFSISLNAGDTIFLSLDFDPERDNITWNGQLSLVDTDGNYPTANDDNTLSPNSESLFLTVSITGIYRIVISSSDGSSGTYYLSTSVLPPNTSNVFTYTSNLGNSGQPLPDGPGRTTSTINIPVNKRIASLKFSMNFVHGNIDDLDVRLTSPSGNTVILFKDLLETYPNIFPTPIIIRLDDNAALPLGSFPILNNFIYQPPKEYRLSWFNGQMSQGVWTLSIDDDSPGSTGTLYSWTLEIEEQLPITGTITSIYSNDFETNDGGFIHSGTQDEWERGTPSFVPITTANSGTKCWKTDLDNTYEFNSNTNLVSPNIYIPEIGINSVYLTWAQKFQFSSDDIAYVEIQEVGTINTKRVWQWFGASMIDTFFGSPNYTIHQSAGWGVNRVDISEFSNKTIRLIFHFESSSFVPLLAGWAIDDVNVFKTFCPSTQNLTANYTGVYSRVVASTTITATNQITADIPTQSKANIVYQSGNSITLLPSFKADAAGGATFTAQIGGCN